MFQRIFQAQSEQLLFWPLVALVIFVGVFALRVAHAFMQSDALTTAQSRLLLDDEANHE